MCLSVTAQVVYLAELRKLTGDEQRDDSERRRRVTAAPVGLLEG